VLEPPIDDPVFTERALPDFVRYESVGIRLLGPG